MSGMLNIGYTGLSAAQAHLITASHNLSNAAVSGYHRQYVVQGTAVSRSTGVGFFGNGTQIETVKRAYSQFLENQVLSSATRLSEYDSYLGQIDQINNMLADSSSGISPSIEKFFAGLQEVASNPTSVSSRQSLISNAEAMINSFNTMYDRLNEMRHGVEGDIKNTVDQVNLYTAAIADMNQRILEAKNGNHSPNDLLDQRDQLIAELNQLVEVTTYTDQKTGSVNVYIGSGQALVLGSGTVKMAIAQDPHDPQRGMVGLVAQNGVTTALPENLIKGGSLSGLLAFRRESLDAAQNQLGLVALGIAEKFNQQHRLGIDLDGMFGKDFFKSPTPSLMPQVDGATASITDVSSLTGDDYVLSYDSGSSSYTLKTKDGRNVPLTQTVVGANTVFSGAGMEISIPTANLGQIPAQGLLIQPVRYAARDIDMAITDPRKVAAGDPVSAFLSEMPGDKVLSDYVSDVKTLATGGMDANNDGIPDFTPVTVKYDPATKQLIPSSGTIERFDPVTKTWVAGGAYDPTTDDNNGVRYRILSNPGDPEAQAFEFTAKGDWEANATITFRPSEAGVADNRNAVALGALQTTKVMLASDGGEATATFEGTFAALVSKIGSKTRELQINEKAQLALLNQALTSRDALSGVNLDEEAVNLIRYQQAYQASSKVMSVAQTLFDTVLSIAR